MSEPCCAPRRDPAAAPTEAVGHVRPGSGPVPQLVALPGGTFTMGTDRPGYEGDGEHPARPVRLSPCAVGATAVTNAEFGAFVAATGHRTDAERFGWSFVFAGVLPDDFPPTRAMVGAEWWRQVEGATWAHPEGPSSDVDDRADHPVVHVSWVDAVAFCRWSGTRLPTEAEWEYAAAGGRHGAVFPWGDELEPGGEHRMNVWQGAFPSDNSGADGWIGTAPVRSYPANDFGLYEMCGNVWEWCADWFTNHHTAAPATDPAGPRSGHYRVIKGGSYLCHHSYCHRYRIAARSHNTPDSSTGNMGFRVVAM